MNARIEWHPSPQRIKQSTMLAFAKANKLVDDNTFNYQKLYQWSIDNKAHFWQQIIAFFNIKGNFAKPVIEDANDIEASVWFPNASLNFTENLLADKDPNSTAIIGINNRNEREKITYGELAIKINSLACYFHGLGLKQGDVVCALEDNSISTIICCLAAAQIGAIWTACSYDFGLDAITERFSQTSPKLLCTVGSFNSVKKDTAHIEKLNALLEQIPSIEHVVLNQECSTSLWPTPPTSVIALKDIPAINNRSDYPQLPFNHPLYIVYSSGTTGKPKCIVHGTGGTLLQHVKELALHCELKSTDTLFFQTSCGWMMWNWMVSALFTGAALIVFEGSPLFPSPAKLFTICQQEKVTVFGANPRYFAACEKANVSFPYGSLPYLKTILSTGSVLIAEQYHYLYQQIKEDVLIGSISGGTDIISCFSMVTDTQGVKTGECQVIGLGMQVEVFTPEGESVINEVGELVCTATFPSKPIGFWHDNGDKFHQAYFAQFPNVWAHGDYVEKNEQGRLIFHGRSDATLNPGGIRIGSAEIYRQLQCFPEITDAIATEIVVGQHTQLVLFITLSTTNIDEKNLTKQIKKRIAKQTSENHVPQHVIIAPDLPRTYSGKTVELIVKNLINKQDVNNSKAIVNPECLAFFANFSLAGN